MRQGPGPRLLWLLLGTPVFGPDGQSTDCPKYVRNCCVAELFGDVSLFAFITFLLV